MAFSYPEFHGRKDEDIEDFLEKMEMACISNHVQAPAQMLRLLQICLKGDARAWSKSHEADLQMADPPIQVTWDILRQALTENFVRLEDPDKVWHEIQGLKQQEAEPIDDYIKKFSLLWESLCEALQPQGAPPDMMKKDRFLAGLKENLRWRVELKKPRTYEDTLEVARNKEWKIKRLTQLGVSSLPGVPEMKQANFVQSCGQEEVHHTHVIPVVAPVVPPTVTLIQDDGLRQDMRQVVDLMKNLSLNLLSNAGNHHGQGRQFNQTNSSGGQNSGGGKRWKNVPTCYNCGELGHISPQCDKPKRLGGDMYPLPTQLPNRSSDYGIEIKGDETGLSRFTTKENGKAKVLSVVKLEKTSVLEDSLVMPIGKRTTEEKEGRSGAGPSKKKGKVHEGEDAKVKRKRRARRKFHVTDFPLGEGQESYSLREDLISRKADVTFGQLVEMVPKLKWQWKKLVNPIEREQDRGSVRVLAVDELPDICPIVDVWHKRKNLGQGYVDGGAQICVITQTCVEKMGFAVAGVCADDASSPPLCFYHDGHVVTTPRRCF
ncbi:hypothetical protein L7F22_058382 [Adiantum nelumboides]|nr:hypothetical protein [Adiantum nelumboides]